MKAVCSVDSSQWVMEEMMGGFFTLIYGRDDIVGSHANMPHKGLDLMVPKKTHAGKLCAWKIYFDRGFENFSRDSFRHIDL